MIGVINKTEMQEEAKLWKTSYNRIFIVKVNGPQLLLLYSNDSMMFEKVLSDDGVSLDPKRKSHREGDK